MNSELHKMITDCDDEINDIALLIAQLHPLEKSVSYFTNYALIKACGTLEYVYRSIVADFINSSSIPQVQTYIDKKVRTGSQSVTYGNMCSLLGQFDEAWAKNFKDLINNHPNGQRLISASNSLVENRHKFAHGKNPTIGFSTICQYYYDTRTLVGIFDSVVI